MYPIAEQPDRALNARDHPHHSEVLGDEGQTAELVTVLSHELRGPLGAIRSALQVLQKCGDDPATRAWAVGVLDRQSHQMSCLIEGLLELSRSCHAKVQIHRQPVVLDQIVDVAIETVRACIEERSHELEVVLPPEPVILEADPTRLEQVLTNLLANAVKYTNPGGRIRLAAEPEEDAIVLRVRDTGIGIAPELLPHVFDPFWQSPPAACRSQGGLGIGLALVRQLVALHGGSVSAFSAGPGLGSEFVVRLPRTMGERAISAPRH